jgi:3',5'-cyclic AMP phosphodiesterase CpdA
MRKLFVIMPFGRKQDLRPGLLLDFDKTYQTLIRPAAEAARWTPLRIDEVTDTGLISDHYLRELFAAEMVLADVSLPNANVYYELGIRQAIATGGTVLIAFTGAHIPFDLSSQRVLFYDNDDPARARQRLAEVLVQAAVHPSLNPVRTFLEKMAISTSSLQDNPAFERDLANRVERCRNADQLIAVWQWVKNQAAVPAAPLLMLSEKLSDRAEWSIAADVLRFALATAPPDFELYRRLGYCLQFAGAAADQESLNAFERALELNPNDPETLGMMGGRAKRLGRYTEAADFYAQAAIHSPNSLYILVNQAFLGILTTPSSPQLGIDLYRRLAERIESRLDAAADEWIELVWGECLFAIGRYEEARSHYGNGAALSTSIKSLQSAARQLDMLAEVGFRGDEARSLAALLRRPQGDAEGDGGPAPVSNRERPVLPVWIHLSDLHFGSAIKNGKRESVHRFYDGENSQSLSKHLADEFARRRSHFSFDAARLHLVISGDLTYSGAKEEYQSALECLEEVCRNLNIDKRRVHMIPGNHDVNWQAAAHDRSHRFDDYLVFLVGFYGEALFRERYPLIQAPLSLAHRPAASDILAVNDWRESGFFLAGLNSCVYETEQNHYGFVGEAQLKRLRDIIADLAVPGNVVRVAVIHHHLHPFPELLRERDGHEVWTDLSTIRDAGFVERSLERFGFDLILHGHKHKPQLRETVVEDPDPSKARLRRLIVCGAGSVSCTELEPNVPNHYQVIELRCPARSNGAELVRIEWRKLPIEPGAEWSTQRAWSIAG